MDDNTDLVVTESPGVRCQSCRALYGKTTRHMARKRQIFRFMHDQLLLQELFRVFFRGYVPRSAQR